MTGRRRPGRTSRPRRRERGSASLELAIVAPALLLLTFLGVQAGLYYYGRVVAIQTARDAVAQMRLVQTRSDFEARRSGILANSESYAQNVGHGALTRTRVTLDYEGAAGARRTRAVVTGSTISLIGIDLTVTVEAEGPIERFTDDNGGAR